MLSSEEVRSVTFEKSMRGYRIEDVDAFLEQVAAGVDQLTSEKADLEKKLYILAQKVEEYRGEEDTLKSALINAQRLGENVIHEARSKADGMIREATGKAQRILDAASLREQEEKDKLRELENEVVAFKGNVLSLYQQHIESLSALDEQVNKAHSCVFGEPYPAPQEESAGDEAGEPEEITDAPVEASAGETATSIVDSYQGAVLNKDEND